MSGPDVPALAHLAEVAVPPADSLGAGFLLSIAEDVAERFEQLAERFDSEEIPSVAEMALDMPDAGLWVVWTDLRLWDEDAVALVAPDTDADMTTRAEAVLMAVGMRLAAALVAERIAASALT